MATIRVITDSASDLPLDIANRLNIAIVPLTVRFGDEEFVDGRDLNPHEFWAKCKTSSELPETAAPSPGAFQEAFLKAKAEGADGVVVVALSSDLSATHQSATLAAQAVADQIPVKIVDSRAVTMAEGMIAIDLAERAAAGASMDELVARGEELAGKVGVCGTIDTLEHLIKGGRLKGAKAVFGSMLSIKPLLELKDGLVAEAGRARTRTKAFAALVAAAKAAGPIERIAVTHGDAPDVDVIVAMLKEIPTVHELIIGDMGSTVGTHGGPGIVGLAWIRS
jgi:DegV family protein with EDD domain